MTTDQIAGQYTYLSFADELRALLPGKVVVPGAAGKPRVRRGSSTSTSSRAPSST